MMHGLDEIAALQAENRHLSQRLTRLLAFKFWDEASCVANLEEEEGHHHLTNNECLESLREEIRRFCRIAREEAP